MKRQRSAIQRCRPLPSDRAFYPVNLPMEILLKKMSLSSATRRLPHRRAASPILAGRLPWPRPRHAPVKAGQGQSSQIKPLFQNSFRAAQKETGVLDTAPRPEIGTTDHRSRTTDHSQHGDHISPHITSYHLMSPVSRENPKPCRAGASLSTHPPIHLSSPVSGLPCDLMSPHVTPCHQFLAKTRTPDRRAGRTHPSINPTIRRPQPQTPRNHPSHGAVRY